MLAEREGDRRNITVKQTHQKSGEEEGSFPVHWMRKSPKKAKTCLLGGPVRELEDPPASSHFMEGCQAQEEIKGQCQF